LSIIIFFASLFLETFHINNGHPTAWSLGLANLILGIFSGNISWLANIFKIPPWILTYKKSGLPIVFSLIASILAFSFYINGKIIINEAGHTGKVSKYLVGYWVWFSSMTSYLIYHIVILIMERMKNKSAINFV
jgi:hypothetical protein